MKQYSKMTKASLVRKIMKALKKLPKTKLVKLCYQLEKKKLPKLTTMQEFKRETKKLDSITNQEKRRLISAIDQAPRLPIKRMNYGLTRLRKKTRSAKQRANDKRLGLMAKRRARVRRR